MQLSDRLSQTRSERTRQEQSRTEISREQTRIRENMGKLAPNSDLYNRYIKKLDQQETELAASNTTSSVVRASLCGRGARKAMREPLPENRGSVPAARSVAPRLDSESMSTRCSSGTYGAMR